MDEEHYPEHIKLARVRDYSQAIGEFLEWMQGEGYVIAKHTPKYGPGSYPEGLIPAYKPIQDLLAEFFEIDQKKLEEERKQMLKAITVQQARTIFIDEQVLKEAVASAAIDRDGDGQTIALGPVTVGETIEKTNTQD